MYNVTNIKILITYMDPNKVILHDPRFKIIPVYVLRAFCGVHPGLK